MTSVAESEFPLASRRRRRFTRQRIGHALAPYALLAPTALAIGVILGYPLYLLVRMSFEKYGLFELIRHKGRWVGTANYAHILHDGQFWHVLLRTIVFTVVNVTLTMVLGTAIALLLLQVSRWLRVRADDRPRPRLVGARDRRGGHLALDGGLRVRRPELDADEAPHRQLHQARLVREPVDRLRRDHGAGRLGRDSVRHDHGLRRPCPGPAGVARGGRDRRREAVGRCSAR